MSVYRLALKAIVETCIGQGAWIWVSGFRKGKKEAKLEDFKMFDEASRGLYGALVLLWRMKASAIADVPVSCATANCSWPIFPSLAVCGACTGSLFGTSCDPQKRCSYSMPSGTSIYDQSGAPFGYYFTVAPSNGSSTFPSKSSKAIISIFDMMSLAKTARDSTVQAYQCGVWFCLRSYNVTVTNGVANRSVTVEWSKSDFEPKSSAHYDEYVFLDIPPEMNAKQHTRYSIPSDSLQTLRAFMDKLTLGNASQVTGAMTYDTDWIQAMDAATKSLPSLSSWISRLSLSLTTDIQLTGTVQSSRNSEYSGTAYIMAPRVEVNWYWVAYPATLMIFAFVYLMQTMLFCHVSRTIHSQVRDGMDKPEGLNYRVGRTEVELIRNDNGEWIFTEPRSH
ncbi:hypothetical protein GGR58DRAFT_512122 [Xylaria digitata]|nr:hypothetical protein GGR58DRAFT_512122 [Xylaria digitata]